MNNILNLFSNKNDKYSKENSIVWRPDLKDYSKVAPSAYKIIYQEAKERFEECASESESITEKSIKIFIGKISIISFLVGFVTTHSIYLNWVGLFIFGILVSLDLVLLYQLISPRGIYHRGLLPKTMFPTELDEEQEEERESIVYHQIICILQDKTEKFYHIINERIKKYWLVIVLSLIVLIITIRIISTAIYHP